MLTRIGLIFVLLLNGDSNVAFADIKFVKIFSKHFSGIVVGSDDTSKRVVGNLLKITGKDCYSGSCKPCRRMTEYIGLAVGHMSPGGKYNDRVEKEFIQQNNSETQSELLFRLANGIASNIGWVGYNDEFGSCDVTLEIGNSAGIGCNQKPDCSLELGKSNKCVARRFNDVQSPGLEIFETSTEKESTCLSFHVLRFLQVCKTPRPNV